MTVALAAGGTTAEQTALAALHGERPGGATPPPTSPSIVSPRGIDFEARGERLRGQMAVAQSIVNRVKNPSYPDHACGVVYQNMAWFDRCQFTFACDRIRDRITDAMALAKALGMAKRYATGAAWRPERGAATHDHAVTVPPRWVGLMRRMDTIDRHIVEITKGGGWT